MPKTDTSLERLEEAVVDIENRSRLDTKSNAFKEFDERLAIDKFNR